MCNRNKGTLYVLLSHSRSTQPTTLPHPRTSAYQIKKTKNMRDNMGNDAEEACTSSVIGFLYFRIPKITVCVMRQPRPRNRHHTTFSLLHCHKPIMPCQYVTKEMKTRAKETPPLTLLPLPLANLCRETTFDSRDGSPTAATVASDETKTVLALA